MINKMHFMVYFILISIIWTAMISYLVINDYSEIHREKDEIPIKIANAYFNKDLAIRKWVAAHVGVYVEIDSITPPNKYLSFIEERDIITPSGRKLTLMNPAYITRQIFDSFSELYGVFGHLTSLKLLRPENKPDDWEKMALEKFEDGVTEVSEFTEINNESVLRFMKPLKIEQSCLKCHGHQGYRIGDIRGGISIILPVKSYIQKAEQNHKRSFISYSLIWLLGIVILFLSFVILKRRAAKQKEIESALKKNLEEHRRILDSFADGIYICSPDYKIEYINSSMAKMIGENKLGAYCYKSIYNLDKKCDWCVYENLKPNESIDYEVKDSFKDKILIVRGILLNSGSKLSVYYDISKIKEAEKEIRKLSTAVEQSPLTIMITDTNANIEYANPMFTELTGYSLEEVKGKNMGILQSGKTPKETFNELWETITQGKTWQGEFINKKKNGEEFYEYAVIAPITDSNGKIINYIALKNDITRRKKIEFELKNQNEKYAALNEEYVVQNEDLIEAKEKAEESDRLKSSFLANMSHEIRTPMNSIVGFSSLLEKQDLSREKKKYYTKIIIKSTTQLLSIINNILDISKIEAGMVVINKQEIIINELLSELKGHFLIEAEKKGLSLTVIKFPDNEKSNIYTDEVKLRQIIANLLSNAIKFTHKGEIEFGYLLINNFFEFYVKDTGIGISSENQKIIFDRFRQIELPKSRIYGGNGLGLSISKELTRLLGGTMWLNSEPEKGSTFYFNIPYIQKPAGLISTGKKQDKQIKFPDWSSITIMVAEDEESNYIYIEEILESTNVKLLHVVNGKEAVELCRINKKIDLVLMDVKMPVMDGYEATKAIKKLRPGLPVIIQTAYAFDEDRKIEKDIGYNDFITKPIKSVDFIKTIKKYLK